MLKSKSKYKRVTVDGVRIQKHVYIWEKRHGVKVPEGKIIHHADGDKANNHPDNLVMISERTHRRIHAGWYMKDPWTWVKPCGMCGEEKPESEFYKRASGKISHVCGACRKESIKEYREANKEKLNAKRRERRRLAKENKV